MTRSLPAVFGLAAALALPGLAAAQTDFTKAAKIACTPDSVTRCGDDKKCTTRPASARDKGEVLVIDFAGKKASVRKGSDVKSFGDVVDDKVEGDVRSFAVAEPGKGAQGEKLAVTLSKAGKLTLLLGGNGNKAEATCVAEP